MIGMMITLTPSDLHLIKILYYTRKRLLKGDVIFLSVKSTPLV